jgi:ankyrin repeat protein
LHFCVQWFEEPGYIACGELLVKAGADVNEPTKDGLTVLILAAQRGLDRMVKWLIHAGADVHVADREGNTALLSAMKRAANASPAVIKQLLRAGADPGKANRQGATAISLADESGVTEEIRQLIRGRNLSGSKA